MVSGKGRSCVGLALANFAAVFWLQGRCELEPPCINSIICRVSAMRKKVRVWEVIRLRAKGEYVGRVRASDEKAAKKAALKELPLSAEDERRLLVRPTYGAS
jgi:hypothetical protein